MRQRAELRLAVGHALVRIVSDFEQLRAPADPLGVDQQVGRRVEASLAETVHETEPLVRRKPSLEGCRRFAAQAAAGFL